MDSGPGLINHYFVFLFPSEAVVWFHITSSWHMLWFKPITVFIHVWSDWPVPLWRGWPHASLSPIVSTIWQSGVFFSVSYQSGCFLFHFFISSVSEYLAFHSSFFIYFFFKPHGLFTLFGSCIRLNVIFSSSISKEPISRQWVREIRKVFFSPHSVPLYVVDDLFSTQKPEIHLYSPNHLLQRSPLDK